MITFIKKLLGKNGKITTKECGIVQQWEFKNTIGGFIPRECTETAIPLTDYLYSQKEFLWKCHDNFSKIKYETINFRKHGDEKYLQINEDTRLFVRWFGKGTDIGKFDFCFVHKDIPVIQIDCNTTNGKRTIRIGHSSTILHFIDNQKYVCGQFGGDFAQAGSQYDNLNDDTFYFMKYKNKIRNEGFQNNLFTDTELLVIIKKCINILNSIWEKDIVRIDEEKKELIVEEKMKYSDAVDGFLHSA